MLNTDQLWQRGQAMYRGFPKRTVENDAPGNQS